jgi:hypothetical protein
MSWLKHLMLFRHYRSLRALAHGDMFLSLGLFPLRCQSLFFSDSMSKFLLGLNNLHF